MPVSKRHKETQDRAAGKTGKKEVALPGGRRLDAATSKRAVEVELSGRPDRLRAAASRLKSAAKAVQAEAAGKTGKTEVPLPGGRRLDAATTTQKILAVPQRDIAKGVAAMKTVGTRGTVRNLTGTKSVSVTPSRSNKPASGRTSKR